MKIVLAFDSYKGAISAMEACEAACTGLARLSPTPQTILCPLSDGGEGFAEAMGRAGQGITHSIEVTGPRFAPVRADIVLLHGGKTAVLESAQACGLGLIPPGQRSPSHVTTYGLGEMIAYAVDLGVEEIVIGLGGSATNDAGMGLLSALGWRFLNEQGEQLPPVGASLGSVACIEPGSTLSGIKVIAACDVDNPLYGPLGAAYVYAPQKGATPEEVRALDHGLEHFAAHAAAALGRDLSAQPGAGAAGGLGFALLAFLGAEFRPGASLAIELSGLAGHLAGADLCLTGEGCTDAQTAHGKLPAAVAACCARAQTPCVCLSGALGADWRTLYQHHIAAAFSVSSGPQDLPTAIASTADALADTAEAVARLMLSRRPS